MAMTGLLMLGAVALVAVVAVVLIFAAGRRG
jgi:hypothetical protein